MQSSGISRPALWPGSPCMPDTPMLRLRGFGHQLYNMSKQNNGSKHFWSLLGDHLQVKDEIVCHIMNPAQSI